MAIGVLGVVVGAVTGELLVVPFGAALAAAPFAAHHHERRAGDHRQVDHIDRLSRAEVAVATALDRQEAAHELAEHAIALLGAPNATVLIETDDDTIRVTAGAADGTGIYGAGSRMRLLEIDGVPCGSISVGGRGEDRPYTDREERMLEALAERVSSTLARLRLFDQVQTEQAKLADVLGSSSDGIYSAAAGGRVESWNPAMERITGVPAEKAIGESCCRVFRPLDSSGEPAHGSSRCPGRLGRSVGPVELQHPGPGGDPLWLTATFSPMAGGGYVAVVRDITEQKALADLKTDFLATISHELRTPLTPIRGFLATLLDRGGELADTERSKIYEVMLNQSGRLERLINDLLLATSLQGADTLFLVDPVDWATAASDVVALFSEQHPERDFRLEIDDDVPPAMADRQRAEQVLTNLITNALRYSPEDSPVTVGMRVVDGMVETRVDDKGPGVDPEQRGLIFERFVRLGDHLTRPDGGAGLGLFIARRMVEGMGGTIAVADSDGGGASFRFTLPVDDGALDPRLGDEWAAEWGDEPEALDQAELMEAGVLDAADVDDTDAADVVVLDATDRTAAPVRLSERLEGHRSVVDGGEERVDLDALDAIRPARPA